MVKMMTYTQNYKTWQNEKSLDKATMAELESIQDNPGEIEDRFYKDLEFGTGGMRGVLGAGTNRLNIYTIGKATQGLANYLLEAGNKEEISVAIAHDSRHMSPEFTLRTALVLNASGIKTYVFDTLQPTPLLSYAVRALGCAAGIVITASHNPPEYNGYKVYGPDGGQCTFPTDEAIIRHVNAVDIFKDVKVAAEGNPLFATVPASVEDGFIDSVKAISLNPGLATGSSLNIVFTPLHGAGNQPVQRVLREMGYQNLHIVKEQEQPDGNFPTVGYPNPEDIGAFTLGIDLAKKVDGDIIIATDPDCDRVGVAVKHDGQYQLLTGNMAGIIMADYIINHSIAQGKLPADGALISTVVSTNMLQSLARVNGLQYIDVLTGFKYIGEQMTAFERAGTPTYVFGMEESYGYLPGDYARDKDGVGAALLICEIAAYYKAQNKTLIHVMEGLYKKYGVYRESIRAITLKGLEGIETIKKVMASLRHTPPQTLAGHQMIEIRDYQTRIINQTGGLMLSTEKGTNLPVSDVLYYVNEQNSWACVRPSGTEPKLKIYFGVELPATATVAEADQRLEGLMVETVALVEGRMV